MNADVDWRELLLNATLVFVTVMVVFAGLEVSLRAGLVGDVQARSEYPTVEACSAPPLNESSRIQFHPEYGWTNEPNRQFIRQHNSYQEPNRWTINAQGFRDTYDSGEQNVIVVGDSFVTGYLADDNETFPYLLDRWSPNTSFHSYGAGGYGTTNQLMIYRNVSSRIDHEVVVIGYFMHNDMLDNYKGDFESRLPRPEFTVRDGEAVLVSPPEDPDVSTETERSSDRGLVGSIVSSPVVNGFQSVLSQHTYTYRYLRPRLTSVLRQTGVLQRPTPPAGEELERHRNLTRALMDEFATEAASNDAEVVVVLIPDRGDVRPRRPTYYRPSEAREYWATQRAMMQDLASDHDNVQVLDLKPALQTAVENDTRVYGVADEHLDDYGYRVTARTIHDRLRQEGYVGPRAGVSGPPEEELSSCST